MASPTDRLCTRVQLAHIHRISLEQVDLRIEQGYIEQVGTTLNGLALYREKPEET